MTGQMRFHGQIALVTGAGRGIGRAIAITLADQGAVLMVNSLHEANAEAVAAEIRSKGSCAQAYAADVSDEIRVQALVEATVRAFGTVHILVNNAGILSTTQPLESISGNEWDHIMAVNARSVFFCTKWVLPLMKAQRRGKVVNIASIAARSTAILGGVHYTASKAAVLGLTRQTAREVAAYNINVNAVAPSNTDTDMVRAVMTAQQIEQLQAQVPLRRRGTPQDVANLVAFLVSEEASYITGATVDINGGYLII